MARECLVMPDRPTRLCVLADPYLRTDQVRSLERALEETGISVPLVLVNDSEDRTIDPEAEANAINNPFGVDTIRVLLDVLERERAWALVFAEKKLAEELGTRAASWARVRVEDVPCLSDSDIQYVPPVADGDWTELPPAAVDRVRAHCDVAVRFGFGLLKGDVLEAPDFGVLSFHAADIRRYRGLGVPQAWLDGCDTMGVTLQRLSEEIDGGEIVAYGETTVEDCATVWDAYDRVYDVKAGLLAAGIENLRDPTFDASVPESLGPYYPTGDRRRLSFAGRTLLKDVSGMIARLTDERCAGRE